MAAEGDLMTRHAAGELHPHPAATGAEHLAGRAAGEAGA